MDWLNILKQSKVFSALAVTLGAVMFLGTLAGAINSLIDFFNQGWLEGVGGWYVAATGWLSHSISVPAWLLIPTTAIIGAASIKVLYALKPDPKQDELTEEQQNVLAVVGVINHVHDHKPTLKEISEACELTAAIAERAVDALVQRSLIRQTIHHVPRRAFEAPQVEIVAAITRQGRDYLLDAGFDPSNPHHPDEQEA